MEHSEELTGDKHDNGQRPSGDKHLVVFNLDGKEQQIDKGKYLVSFLKEKFGIPADYELDLVVDGTFEPLKDTDEVKIHGGEVLVSHVRGGGSS